MKSKLSADERISRIEMRTAILCSRVPTGHPNTMKEEFENIIRRQKAAIARIKAEEEVKALRAIGILPPVQPHEQSRIEEINEFPSTDHISTTIHNICRKINEIIKFINR